MKNQKTETPTPQNSYLDLSKLSKKERKETVIILKKANENIYEVTEYCLNKGQNDIEYKFLAFGLTDWSRYSEIQNKSEITFSQFKEMIRIEGKEEKNDTEEFLKAVQSQRSQFGKHILENYNVHNFGKLRTEIDSLMIMYDQMAHRIKSNN